MTDSEETKEPVAKKRIDARVVGIIGLCLLGSLLRFWRLGFSNLWIDEWGVLWIGNLERTVGEIFSEIMSKPFETVASQHMPFQYIWVHIFQKALSIFNIQSIEWPARLPFALLGCASLPLFYAVGRDYFNRKVGFWALWLSTVSFFHIYYSRELTSYVLLIFWIALHLYGLAGIRPSEKPASFWRGVCFLLGVYGALMTHISAWIFFAAEMFAIGICIIQYSKKHIVDESFTLKPGLMVYRYVLLLFMVGLLPLCYIPLKGFLGGGMSGDLTQAPPTPLSLRLLAYQFGFYGWGVGPIKLVAFLACVSAGYVALFRNKDWPISSVIMVVTLALLPALVIFFMATHGYRPRYTSVCYVPWLMICAVGLSWITEQFQSKLPDVKWKSAFAIGLCASIPLILVLGPLNVLYTMRSKALPTYEIVEWLKSKTPEHGLYVWQAGSNLREIPGMYPVSKRQPAFATLHSGSVKDPVVAESLSLNAREIFFRYPVATMLSTDFHLPIKKGPWSWIETVFAKSDRIRNESNYKLHEYGFGTAGLSPPSNVDVTMFYNTTDDLITRARWAGRSVISWPEGPGWKWVQTEVGQLFITIQGGARLKVVNLNSESLTLDLKLLGVSQGEGNLMAKGEGNLEWQQIAYGPTPNSELRFKGLVIAPGESGIDLKCDQESAPNLFIYYLEPTLPEGS